MSENDTAADVTVRKYVVYECGSRCWDTGIGGAPDRCSRCGAGVAERYVDTDTDQNGGASQ